MTASNASNEAASAGVHGYSSPHQRVVIFSVDSGMEEYTRRLMQDIWPDDHYHWGEGIGSWEGVEEVSFYLSFNAFMAQCLGRGRGDVGNLKIAVRNQEKFLYLDFMGSQNRRGAVIFGKEEANRINDLPRLIWHSVPEEYARKQQAWSCFNGQYFVAEQNPARCIQETKDRETAQIIADLRFVLWHTTRGFGSWPRVHNLLHNTLSRSSEWLVGKTLNDGRVLTSRSDVDEYTRPR